MIKLPKLKIGDLKSRLPIIQGGMAVRISMAPLAAAVAEEGGVGVIGASGLHPEELAEEIKSARKKTKGIIGVNIMVATREFRKNVNVAIKEKADLLIIGAGFPGKDFLKDIKEKIPVFLIVSEPKAVATAAHLGLAGVILESGKAGGHIGIEANQSIWTLLPQAVDFLKKAKIKYKDKIDPNFSLVAAGGILNGLDIFRALKIGANGVQMGTIFSVGKESSAHDNWKKTVKKAKKKDIIIIKSPVGNMPLRVIKNPFVDRFLNDDIPELDEEFQFKNCIGCLDDCGRDFCIYEALSLAQQGDVENGVFTIGYRGWEIKNINQPTKKIIQHLMSEFEYWKN